MWATGVVIKRLRVWLHHLLPPPPSSLLLGILFHILLHCLNIILRLMLHVHMLVIWVSLRLRLILNNSTAWPASPTPKSVNYTLRCLSSSCLSTSSTLFPLSPNGCVHGPDITPIPINRIHTCNMHNTTGSKFRAQWSTKKIHTGLSGFHNPNYNNLVRKTKSEQLQCTRKKIGQINLHA